MIKRKITFKVVPLGELRVPLLVHAFLPNQSDSLDLPFSRRYAFLLPLAWIPLSQTRELLFEHILLELNK